MPKSKINLLINLAASDHTITPNEHKVLTMVGKANGFTTEQVNEMLKKPEPIGHLEALTEDQKFEHLFHMIQLMKADGQVFLSEIEFCNSIADRLGYKKGVVKELSGGIYSDPHITSDRKKLMDTARKFLK
jgi:uncharacterized tellurite resistance protein B-like protein